MYRMNRMIYCVYETDGKKLSKFMDIVNDRKSAEDLAKKYNENTVEPIYYSYKLCMNIPKENFKMYCGHKLCKFPFMCAREDCTNIICKIKDENNECRDKYMWKTHGDYPNYFCLDCAKKVHEENLNKINERIKKLEFTNI